MGANENEGEAPAREGEKEEGNLQGQGQAVEELRQSGIELEAQTRIAKVEKCNQGLMVHMKTVHMNHGHAIEVDSVIKAIGRNPNTEGLGLQSLGIWLVS